MRRGRAILIPAIITLSFAGVSLASTAAPAVAATTASAQAPASTFQIYYHL